VILLAFCNEIALIFSIGERSVSQGRELSRCKSLFQLLCRFRV